MVVYNGHGHPEPEQMPAVIRAVHADGSLDLTVFGPRGCTPASSVKQGTIVGTWNWPTRV